VLYSPPDMNGRSGCAAIRKSGVMEEVGWWPAKSIDLGICRLAQLRPRRACLDDDLAPAIILEQAV
jgi:hypothetical protein